MKVLSYEEYNKKVKGLKTVSDVSNFAKELVAPTLQAMLDAEMDDHLGYDRHARRSEGSNYRNGHSQKTIKGNFGEARIDIPRDRNSSFTPIAVKKYETVESDLEEKIISMYAKGMSTRDINSHMQEIYGVSISADKVSSITDQILPLVTEWQNRPLNHTYVITYLDGIHFKIRDEGKILSKCAYIILGITDAGHKEILGIWVGESEGSKFWLRVLNEIHNRGVRQLLICCIDGLKGFSEAISAVYPEAEIQKCIVHQIRNTTKYISHKEKKRFCSDLRTIYTAPSEESGFEALQSVKAKWSKYSVYLESWEKNWSELSTFFMYPESVRKLIYTTNPIESLNRQFRKVTKTTSVFPHEQSLRKLLWLAQKDITKKWSMPVHNWGEIISQILIFFPGKIEI